MTTPPVPPEPGKSQKAFPTKAYFAVTILSTLMVAGSQAVSGTGGFSNVNDPIAHALERFIFGCVLFGPMIAGVMLVFCVLYTLQK